MSKPQNPMSGFMESMKSAQHLFAANPVASPYGRHFWEAQERMLKEAEAYSTAWFQRRHEATQAAMKASEDLAASGAKDPALVLETMAQLRAKSMERLAADARECAEMIGRCAGMLVNEQATAMDEAKKNVEKATKTTKNEPI